MNKLKVARERLRVAEAEVIDALSLKDDKKLGQAISDIAFALNLVIDVLERAGIPVE